MAGLSVNGALGIVSVGTAGRGGSGSEEVGGDTDGSEERLIFTDAGSDVGDVSRWSTCGIPLVAIGAIAALCVPGTCIPPLIPEENGDACGCDC